MALPESHLFWVEHPHVLTLGKSGEASNVVVPEARLKELGVQYYPINRGGHHVPRARPDRGVPHFGPGPIFHGHPQILALLEEAVIPRVRSTA